MQICGRQLSNISDKNMYVLIQMFCYAEPTLPSSFARLRRRCHNEFDLTRANRFSNSAEDSMSLQESMRASGDNLRTRVLSCWYTISTFSRHVIWLLAALAYRKNRLEDGCYLCSSIAYVGLKSLWLLASVLISVAERLSGQPEVGQDACAQPS